MSRAEQNLKNLLRPVRDQVRRRVRRGAAGVTATRLERRNRRLDTSVVGEAPVAVSLTTFGARVDTVASTIESIARGSVRPRRLILWLDEVERLESPPPALRRLRDRGLEILPADNFGPHTKYYPYAASQRSHEVPLVTADDDIIYPRRWLEGLLRAHEAYPRQVCCYRANVVGLDGDRLLPYNSWPRCRTTEPSLRHMATGVSGVLYPPFLVEELGRRGDAFTKVAPRADDVWLHWVALRSGVPVAQVASRPRHFLSLPGTQETALMHSNVVEGGNDEQIRALYTPGDIGALRVGVRSDGG